MSEVVNVKELAAEIADQLLKNNRFVTMEDTQEILRYADGIYSTGGETFILSTIQQNVTKKEITNHLCLEVLGHVRRTTLAKRDLFDTNPNIINLKNGLLDLSTFSLQPHTYEYLSVIQLPVKYDALADCPRFKKFLSEVQFAEDIAITQEWFGFVLSPGYKIKKALMLVGDGNNGKSVLLNILKAFLGVGHVAACSLWELENDRFAKADLYGMLANNYADLPDVALEHTGTFKMLTGNDLISAQRKNQQRFRFVNRAKIAVSCNVVPDVKDDTDSFFLRWLILTFPNVFEGDREDHDLEKKLTTEEELSGILNWAIAGLKRLQEAGWQFTNSKSTSNLREEYRRKSSPVWAFLQDCTLVDVDAWEVKKMLYAKFCEYCREKKLPIMSEPTFFMKVPQHRAVSDYRPEVKGGQRPSAFRGIRLRPQDEWGQRSLEGEESV